jgi:putative DNA modification/repair radical SAM protein
MELAQKLAILADAAKYDASCASSGSTRKAPAGGIGDAASAGICHSFGPDGRCISLLKILLTNSCIYDCRYCLNRRSNDIRRTRFTVAQIVGLTIDFYRRNYIEGLFLSSGIIRDADYTMEQLTAVAKALRTEHRFGGYIHLKTIPGAADALVAEAGLYADRLSVNIELPTEADLAQLAPEKKRPALERNMGNIEEKTRELAEDRRHGLKAPAFAPAGQSTQVIVGATPSPDLAILSAADALYGRYRLKRVYYSAFNPIPRGDALLPDAAPPLMREHRLYQADWMLRYYDFKLGEIVDADAPMLDLDIDPKTAWALRHPGFFPIDVNRAPREEMLRIPGIGVQTVQRILVIRRQHALRLDDLLRLKVAWKRAKPFAVAADYHPAGMTDSAALSAYLRPPQQLSLGL